MAILSDIHVYPVKAMRGHRLDEAIVEPWGVQHDRRWLLTDPTYTFLTQREHPRLALVNVQVQARGIGVRAPEMAPLDVEIPEASAPKHTVRIWNDTVEAVQAGADADAWFSRFLGVPCHLVYLDGTAFRPVDARYAVGDDVVSFADAFPVLLTATASLEALNARLDSPLPMNRFRPNLVVSGADPFAEDRWARIRIGSVLFHVVKPCARCVVTTVDQQTGVTGKEPLKTLARFRKRGSKVYFGQNLIPAERGTVRVGDRVEVLAMNEQVQWP